MTKLVGKIERTTQNLTHAHIVYHSLTSFVQPFSNTRTLSRHKTQAMPIRLLGEEMC